jgi:hypothetical protein
MNCPKLLNDAIDGLYAAFSAYPLPRETHPCPCCHAADADDLLHAAPLRELQWNHLADYSTEALMVWGNLDCYRHFLPRIFELVLTAGQWPKTPSPESVFHVLHYGEWRKWPRQEQESIERMLQAVWETVRSHPPIEGGYLDVDQWLSSIANCEDSLASYLKQWAEDERLSASWALSFLVLGSTVAYTDANTIHDPRAWMEEKGSDIREFFNSAHRGAFWRNCDAQYEELRRWVKSPVAFEKLQHAEATCGDADMQREFRAAQRCIIEAASTKYEVVYRQRPFQTAYWDSPNYRLC